MSRRDKDIPEKQAPTVRVEDHCAVCGKPILVVVRTWEWMGSFWGKVYGANLCKGNRCHLKATKSPSVIVREIDRRQLELVE